MAKLKLSLACGAYDLLYPLIEGAAAAPGSCGRTNRCFPGPLGGLSGTCCVCHDCGGLTCFGS